MQRACRTCSLHELCLPLGVSDTDIDLLEKIVHRSRPLPRGKYLFREGDPFTSIFVARSGAVKSFTVAPDGSEQVIGFHLPGELLGLDGLTEGVHAASARTLSWCAGVTTPFVNAAAQISVEHSAGAASPPGGGARQTTWW